jgi:hypothetical protein
VAGVERQLSGTLCMRASQNSPTSTGFGE